MTGRLLVAYSNASNFVSTTAEYLRSLSQCSEFDVRYVHVTNGAELDFDLNDFDAIFQSYCARLPFDNYLSPSYLGKLKNFRGVKLLAVQDEYENTDKLKAGIKEIGYHAVFTCMPPKLAERVCPRADFPGTEFITALTGYVPDGLAERGRVVMPLRERPIHIGYRCRQLPAYYGRLGFDKFEIGRRMREICEERGIPHDIEWSNEKRIYGDAWYEFTGSCRANLGSETGSNVFDFDGSIKETYERLSAERGEPVPYEEFRVYTDPIEPHFDIGQISPRIFEAVVMRTPLILFSGRYLGTIEPDTHYIELKKDFSNIDDVLARLADIDELERMAARAYDRLVGSGEFSYRRFVSRIDATIMRKARELGVMLRPGGRQLGFTDENSDPAEFGSLRERPTVAPHHPAVFLYKHAAQYNQLVTKEVSRLNEVYSAEVNRLGKEIHRLNDVYPAEIARLNVVITDLQHEGGQQNAAYAAEITRLNKAYPAEIARLNTAIAEQQQQANQQNAAATAEIARLNNVYTAEIARLNAALNDQQQQAAKQYALVMAETVRLNQVYSAEIARLNATIEELRRNPAAKTGTGGEQSYAVEIARLNIAISDAGRRVGRAAAPRRPSALARTILLHPGVRRLGRRVLTRLPDRVERRVKFRVGALIARL